MGIDAPMGTIRLLWEGNEPYPEGSELMQDAPHDFYMGDVDDCLADACRSEVLEVIKGNHTRSFILLDVVERTGGKGTPVEFHLGQTVHVAAILTDAISWEWVVLVAGVIIAPGICVVVSTVHLVDDETICRYYHHSGYSLDIVGIIVE